MSMVHPIHPIGRSGAQGSLGSYYAIRITGSEPEFGTMEDFRQLVDKAHISA